MNEVVEMLLPAVEQQMSSPETPFVASTFARLIKSDDIDEDEARRMIAFCLADESERMRQESRPFSLERYQQLLDLLPTMPEQ